MLIKTRNQVQNFHKWKEAYKFKFIFCRNKPHMYHIVHSVVSCSFPILKTPANTQIIKLIVPDLMQLQHFHTWDVILHRIIDSLATQETRKLLRPKISVPLTKAWNLYYVNSPEPRRMLLGYRKKSRNNKVNIFRWHGYISQVNLKIIEWHKTVFFLKELQVWLLMAYSSIT